MRCDIFDILQLASCVRVRLHTGVDVPHLQGSFISLSCPRMRKGFNQHEKADLSDMLMRDLT